MKNYKTFIKIICVALVCSVLPGLSISAAEEAMTSELVNVSGNVYCIYGQGGNVGVLKTDAGFLVIDSQFKKTAADIMKHIAGISPKPVKYLVNTHYHLDHTGGNTLIGKDAAVIMHANCKAALKKNLDPKKFPGASEFLSKISTISKDKEIKLGNETVKLRYFGNNHTSGDVVVVFEKAKVIHPGDLFFNGGLPYIDVQDGSDTANWIRTIKTLCKEYHDYTFIPGHGKVTDAATYLKFAEYLTWLRKKVAAAIKTGKSKEEIVKSFSFEGYEHLSEYGNIVTRKGNVSWVYDEMTRK